jgi:hypothetical protein
LSAWVGNESRAAYDPAIHDTALKRKGCRTVVMKGRPYRGYVHVEADAVKTKGDLDYWMGLALDYNEKVKPEPGNLDEMCAFQNCKSKII